MSEYGALIGNQRLVVSETPFNKHQYDNALDTIDAALKYHPDVELIIKIDDDDWYSNNWVSDIVALYENEKFDFAAQCMANVMTNQRNHGWTPNHILPWDGVGSTFVFSRKCFDAIKANRDNLIGKGPYEDKIWHDYVKSNPDLKQVYWKNEMNYIYFRHGNNTI